MPDWSKTYSDIKDAIKEQAKRWLNMKEGGPMPEDPRTTWEARRAYGPGLWMANVGEASTDYSKSSYEQPQTKK